MPVDARTEHPADPAALLAVLTDEAFLREVAAALGTRVEEVAVDEAGDEVVTTVRMVASTAGIPAVFARFVGGEVGVVDRRTWRPDGDGGRHGELEVGARIFGRTARLSGVRTLTAADGGTLVTTSADAHVDAPLVGRQAEAAVRELAQVVLRREEEVLRRRLAGG
ncbi:DUF2505 domain-containing protein [Blastococcus sp. SYSU D00820]